MLRGIVKDALTSGPLPGVHISFGIEKGTVSDSRGQFELSYTGPGIKIEFSYVGYEKLVYEYKTANDSSVLEILLKPEIREIEEIVVSPGKTEQKLSELTVSTSLIKARQIVENHVLNADELLKQAPGVEVMDGQASIRGGSGYSYGAGSRVLALIDGMPALSADASNIKWQFLPLEMLSQMEIIKGASSVLYGSSALNGIINIRTMEAGPKAITRLTVLSGLYGNPSRKEWKWWSSPRFFAKTTFMHLRKIRNTELGISGRLLTDQGYRKDNEDKYGGFNIKLKRHSTKNEKLNYGFLFSTGLNKKTDFLLWDNAITGGLVQNPATAMKFRGSMLSFDPYISLEEKDRYKHELRARLQHTDNKLPDNPANNSRALSYYTEYQGWYRLFEKLDILFGTSLYWSKINSEFHGNHSSLSTAVYSQAELRPFSRLKITAGIRLETNKTDSLDGGFIPIFRSGINYRAAEFTYLRASFGQGYRYPSIAEKYASTTTGGVIIIPNPELGSESGWSAELGLKQGLSFAGFRGLTDLSLFYTRNQDLIEYIYGIYPLPGRPGEFDLGFRAHNIENSRLYGLEWEYSLLKRFDALRVGVSGGYTYTFPVEFNPVSGMNTDVFLKYRRKHSFLFLTTASFRSMELGINIYAKSKILNIDDVFLDPLTGEKILPGFPDYWKENNKAYYIVDLQAAFKPGSKYSVSASIKNLFNVEYMGRPGDIMPQRNYSLQFNADF